MNLPSLFLQAVYGQIFWAVVTAAVAVGLLAPFVKWPPRALVQRVGLAALVLAFAPGELSYTHWLRLALQLPSGLLVAMCGLLLWGRWSGNASARTLPTPLALALGVSGSVLYLDSAAWMSLDLYARGFGPVAALCGTLLTSLAVMGIVRGVRRPLASTLLFALTLFSVLRLPTGNLWDALLDPMLWLWALASLAARALSWRSSRAARELPLAPPVTPVTQSPTDF